MASYAVPLNYGKHLIHSRKFSSVKILAGPRLRQSPCRLGPVRLISSKAQSDDKPYDIVIAGGGMVGSMLAARFSRNRLFDSLRILILDAGPAPKYKLSAIPSDYSNRVSALSPGSRRLLEEVDAWEKMEHARVQPVTEMQVWESRSDAAIRFSASNNPDASTKSSGSDHDTAASNTLAYIVENDVILAALEESLRAAPHRIDIRYDCPVSKYELAGTTASETQGADFVGDKSSDDTLQPDVSTSEGAHNNPEMTRSADALKGPFTKLFLENSDEIISTRLIVGADGYNSRVRRDFVIPSTSWSYEQHAVVATLRLAHELPLNGVAWQRFLPGGPVAVLPLTPELSSLVWSTSPERANELVNLPEGEFVDALNTALWQESSTGALTETVMGWTEQVLKLAKSVAPSSIWPEQYKEGNVETIRDTGRVFQLPPTFTSATARARFPLGCSLATNYVKSHGGAAAALIGDAAHRVHPLAGQGVNLGFSDAKALSDSLANGVSRGSATSEMYYLREYETSAQRRALPVIGLIDGLHRLYGVGAEPLVALRSVGLMAADSVPAVKDFLKRQAMT